MTSQGLRIFSHDVMEFESGILGVDICETPDETYLLVARKLGFEICPMINKDAPKFAIKTKFVMFRGPIKFEWTRPFGSPFYACAVTDGNLIIVYDIVTKEKIVEFETKAYILSMSHHVKGGQHYFLVAYFESKGYELWNLSTKSVERAFDPTSYLDNADWTTIKATKSYIFTDIGGKDNVLMPIDNGDVLVWDIATGKYKTSIKGHTSSVICMTYFKGCSSMDIDPMIITGGCDVTIRIWSASGLTNVEPYKQLAILDEHATNIESLVTFYEGHGRDPYLLSGSRDMSARLFSLVTFQMLRVFNGHFSIVTSCAVYRPKGQDDSIILTAGQEAGYVHFWNLNGCDVYSKKQNESNTSITVADGGKIYTSLKGEVTDYDIVTGKKTFVFNSNLPTTYEILYSKKSNCIISYNRKGDVETYDLTSKSIVKQLKTKQLWRVNVFDTDKGSYLLLAGSAAFLAIYDLPGLNTVVELPVSNGKSRYEEMIGVNVPEKGGDILFAAQEVYVHIMSMKLEKFETLVIKEIVSGLRTLVVNDMMYLIVTTTIGSIIIFSLPMLIEVGRMKYGYNITCLDCFTFAESAYVVTGNDDGNCAIWSMDSMKLVKLLEGHNSYVKTVNVVTRGSNNDSLVMNSLSPVLISESDENVLIVWDLFSALSNETPFPGAIREAYRYDKNLFRAENEDKSISFSWKRMSSLVEKHGPTIFASDCRVFMDSLITETRKDFITKFMHLAPQCVFVKFDLDGTNVSMLQQAINQRDLSSVRALLKIWIQVMSTNAKSVFSEQNKYVSISKQEMKLLAIVYPAEFSSFMQHAQFREFDLFPPMIENTYFESKHTHYRAIDSIPKNADIQYDLFFKGKVSHKATKVPAFLFYSPVPYLTDLDILQLYVDTSDAVENVDIFNSKLVAAALKFVWHKYGKGIHMFQTILYFLYVLSFGLANIAFHNYVNTSTARPKYYFAWALQYFLLAYTFYFVYLEAQQYVTDLATSDEADKETEAIRSAEVHSQKKDFFEYQDVYDKSQAPNNAEEDHGNDDKHSAAPEKEDDSFISRVISAIAGSFEYFTDIWNFVDAVSYCCTICGVSVRIANGEDNRASRCLLSVASIFVWFKLLYFLRAYEGTGPLVSMIFHIAYDIRFFLLILFIVLIGFAEAFWLLSNVDSTLPFGTVTKSLLSAFMYMLGGGDSDFTGAVAPKLAVLFLVIFLVIVSILMLNLLIALMGDTFARVKQSGLAEWRYELSKFVLEQAYMVKFNRFLQPKFDIDNTPRILFSIRRSVEEADDDTDDLRGHISGIDKNTSRIMEMINKSNEQAGDERTSMSVSMNQKLSQLSDRLNNIEKFIHGDIRASSIR